MPKRKTRTRRNLNWTAIAWTALAANTIAGFLFSPLTAVAKVRVVGVPLADRNRVAGHLQTLKGVPAARVDVHTLETMVQARDEVRTATFRRNVFGSGLLEVVLRRAVARLRGERQAYLAEDGSVFVSMTRHEGLPVVAIERPLAHPNLTLSSPWNGPAIARVCSLVSENLPKAAWTVHAQASGVLCLTAGTVGRVVLGSADAMPDKLGELRKVLERKPDALSQVREINLTAPTAPVYTPLKSTR